MLQCALLHQVGAPPELWQLCLLQGNRLARLVSPTALRRVFCGLLAVSGLRQLGQALTN